MAETRKVAIKRAYTDPESPASFSSAKNVLAEVKKKYPKTNLKEVEDELERLPVFTKNRKRRVRFKRLRTIPSGFMSDVQVDLADFQKYAEQNNNFKYILVGQDVLSRLFFAAPTKSKASNHMIAAFNRIIKQMPQAPRTIYSDKGVEFVAGPVKRHLHSMLIKTRVTQSPDVKAGVAERAIRTLKGRLFKYLGLHETMRWLDVLPKIVASLNRTKCRTTGMRPIDVGFHNATEVWNRVYGQAAEVEKKKPKYEQGDKVRIAKQKTTFEKSYWPNYTDEVYEVEKVMAKKNEPHTYDLKTKEGIPIAGKFYTPELSRTKYDRDSKLVIEKILATRKRRGLTEYLAKWKGRPEEQAAWITQADVEV